MMSLDDCKALVSLQRHCAYHAANKKRFRNLSLKLLRSVATTLRLDKRTYDIRYNAGGVAVSGDAILHHDKFYVMLNADGLSWILVRTCRDRKDYTGGHNRSFSFEKLAEEGVEGLCKFIVVCKGSST